MSTNRPDYNDEDIGRRAFQIRKERAIERTLDRVRQGLKSSWGMFTHKDVEDLGWMIGELWAFMRVRKKWWLGPIVMVLLLLGLLLVFTQGSALAPFIYTLF